MLAWKQTLKSKISQRTEIPFFAPCDSFDFLQVSYLGSMLWFVHVTSSLPEIAFVKGESLSGFIFLFPILKTIHQYNIM